MLNKYGKQFIVKGNLNNKDTDKEKLNIDF